MIPGVPGVVTVEKVRTIAAVAHPSLHMLAVLEAHRAIRDSAPGLCGRLHHRDMDDDDCLNVIDRLPRLPGGLEVWGYVACWQHVTGCPEDTAQERTPA